MKSLRFSNFLLVRVEDVSTVCADMTAEIGFYVMNIGFADCMVR